MKTTLALLIALFSLQIHAQIYKITCKYQYETYFSQDEMTKTFTSVGYTDGSGMINFSANVKDLPAYFFPEDRYGAYWHKNASIFFYAQLQGTTLRYSFMFNNYIRDDKKLSTVFQETRVLDMTEHFVEDDLEFDYEDGRVTNSKINQDDWINEDHVQIDSCQISHF